MQEDKALKEIKDKKKKEALQNIEKTMTEIKNYEKF